MPIQLPLEVIHLIILYIPTTRLRLLCEEDDSLKPLIAPILYKYVSIRGLGTNDNLGAYPGHDYRTIEFHDITLLELNELVSGSIDAKIQHLKITEWDEYVMYENWQSEHFEKFWKLVKDSSEFFLKPIIDFTGVDFTNCMELLPVQNIRHLSIGWHYIDFQIDAFPPNITDLTIRAAHIINIPRLPKSLKHMVVRVRRDDETNLVFEFPPHLELFCNCTGPFSGKLPEGLLKLETKEIHNMKLPDSLIDLKVGPTDSLVTFPPGLKKLDLCTVSSWDAITCLCNLEVLDLSNAGLTTLEGVVFPSLLRELKLQYNELENLNNVMFPGLIHLDISSHLSYEDHALMFPYLIRSYQDHASIKSLSRVQFPKLEYLIARGQPIEDWSMTCLPETLKELEMKTMEDPQTLKFPPHLKVLKIYFKDDLAEYSDLRLPDTLEELFLVRGISSIFDWSLPQLRTMRITKFSGPIKVPESVVDLSLLYKDMLRHCEQIHIPPNVERLEIPYPLEEYPATVTHLRIDYCGVRSFVLPPNVESVNVAYGEFDGSSLTLPNSLISFCGPYVGDLKRPSNWDRDNEFLNYTDGIYDPEDPTYTLIKK